MKNITAEYYVIYGDFWIIIYITFVLEVTAELRVHIYQCLFGLRVTLVVGLLIHTHCTSEYIAANYYVVYF